MRAHTFNAGPTVSVGIDLVDVREVAESISRFGDRYLRRVYTAGEIAYARQAPGETARRLAARFAAKEATLKALGAPNRGIGWRSIEVVVSPEGAPGMALSAAAQRAARTAGVSSLAVSLTHQGDLAAAVVVAERRRVS